MTIAPGEIIYAAEILDQFGRSKYKPADTSRSSTTTLADDPDLIIPVLANAVYVMECYLVAFNTTASVNFLHGWSGPSGATLNNWSQAWNNAGTSTASLTLANIGLTRNDSLDANNAQHYDFRGTLVTGSTAGNFALRWAQGTSNASATVVRAGSWLRLMRVV